MKALLILLACVALAACAGKTVYTIPTEFGPIEVVNTKDYESYDLTITKPDGTVVELHEKGVSASDPLKAAQEANSKLLDKVLSVIPGVR